MNTKARRIPLTDAEIARARHLLDCGLTCAEIAEELNTEKWRIDNAVYRERRLAAKAEARVKFRAARALSDKIAAREIETVPATEPSMRDLLRAPEIRRDHARTVEMATVGNRIRWRY